MSLSINANSAFYSGVEGLNRGMEKATDAAKSIASLSHSSSNNKFSNVTNDLMSLKMADIHTQASSKTIEAADNLIGTIINDIA